MNVTLIRNRDFTDVTQSRRSHTGGLGWDLNPMTGIFKRERRGRFAFRDTEDTHKDDDVTVKSEVGVVQLQAREHQGLLAIARS